MPLLRTRLSLERFIVAPSVLDVTGARCVLCNHVVDVESLVEGEPGWGKPWCKVLVKHHGQEELATFDFGTIHWDHTDLRSYLNRKRWFDPTVQEGQLKKREDAHALPEPGLHGDDEP